MFGFDLRAFEPEHIQVEKLRPYEREYLLSMPNYEKHLQALARIGRAWSIFKDGEHISSAGVVPELSRVGSLWQLPSPNVSKHMITYCKVARSLIDMTLDSGAYKRLWTICPDDRLHNRWMRFMGFEKEGVMRKLGANDEDYVIYARLK